jgi:hypothetical protein
MNFFTEERDKIVRIIFSKGISVPEEHISVFITKHKAAEHIYCWYEAAFPTSLAISLSTARKSKSLAGTVK